MSIVEVGSESATGTAPVKAGELKLEVVDCAERRGLMATTYESVEDLAAALRRAAEAHGKQDRRTGWAADPDWPNCYALFIVRERAGEELPT
jgi:hypothetical protein